jgi:hypothetical protein
MEGKCGKKLRWDDLEAIFATSKRNKAKITNKK